ncbi:MAG TPA: Asp-tRNA(Asn)/Glu-tRNA(Gln) amidotransferase subunit GatC [Oligoflexia bacterium]|nr:Asp-tRNA(Asn)/Glu-tRNA(Gln) amidotransferase subunit GatC [Oligoflexia bacterium]HMP27524.1 Asp-tRNA(Asn)/Glu-tRNA(Gln) amidotransferase subunit GatC [Oligoflexia bacterium]
MSSTENQKKKLAVDQIDLKKTVKLAYLSLTPTESEQLESDIIKILNTIDKLRAIDLATVEPLYQVNGFFNRFREDQKGDHLQIQTVIENAPDALGRFFRVPLVVEKEGDLEQ